MKAHVFISVLAFHVVVIAGLYLLSACSSSSSSGPNAGQTSPGSTGGSIYDSYAQPNRPVGDDSMVVTQANPPQQSTRLDPAFNSGSSTYSAPVANNEGERFEPRRPSDGGFGTTTTPEINPLLNEEEVLVPLSAPVPSAAAVEYTVVKGDSLWKISRQYGLTLNDLLQANGLTENSTINVGQKLVIPSASGGSATVASPSVSPAPAATTESYTVVRGDTLSRIASRFNTTVNDIKAANGLQSDVIQLNQNLTIPVNSRSTGSPAATTQPTTAPAPAPAVSSSAPSDFDGIIHVVESGETPSAIARLYGITTAQLMRDNAIADARKIRVGQKLKIFLGVAQPATTPMTPPSGNQPTSQPVTTPTQFDDSVFDSLEDIPEVEVVPQD